MKFRKFTSLPDLDIRKVFSCGRQRMSGKGLGGEGCIVLFLLTNHGWSDTTLAVPARPCGEPDEEDEEDGGGDDQDQDELEPGGQAAGGQHAVHVVVRGVVDVIMHVIMHVIVVVDVSVHAECL